MDDDVSTLQTILEDKPTLWTFLSKFIPLVPGYMIFFHYKQTFSQAVSIAIVAWPIVTYLYGYNYRKWEEGQEIKRNQEIQHWIRRRAANQQ